MTVFLVSWSQWKHAGNNFPISLLPCLADIGLQAFVSLAELFLGFRIKIYYIEWLRSLVQLLAIRYFTFVCFIFGIQNVGFNRHKFILLLYHLLRVLFLLKDKPILCYFVTLYQYT